MERAEKLLLAPKKQAETRKVQKERQRLERYGEALKGDAERHRSMLLLREPATRLQAELWRLKGATRNVELLDGTRIDLPPGQRVEETVQIWFNSVKKAERGLKRVAVLEKELMRQMLEIGGSDGQAGTEAAQAPVWHARQDTGTAGKEKKKVDHDKNDKRSDGKGKAYRSLMLDQFEVLIGRGDEDNDNLTFRVADSQDFWLHVANLPGSHVVIRNPDRLSEPPRGVLERAAELAAFYSKARDGGKVEVHWCRVADVNKPRGFAPGKVILKSYKSVKVYPNSSPPPR
jgi:predicted ribosome quality control (RQC) complex YloA/Tae2 family protein